MLVPNLYLKLKCKGLLIEMYQMLVFLATQFALNVNFNRDRVFSNVEMYVKISQKIVNKISWRNSQN